jgi:hypothetical protein
MNLSIKSLRILPFLTLIFLAACNNSAPSKKENDDTKTKQDSVKNTTLDIPVDKKLTETSKLIAGMDTALNFRNDLSDKAKFIEFHKSSQSKFDKIEVDRLSKINTWGKELLKKNNLPDNNFCFYPFAGGDFIHAHYLYPNAKEYLMLALEPIGVLPDIYTLKEKEIMEYLYNIDTALRNIYNHSYFITKNMNSDISGKRMVSGILPMIIWGIARAKYEIVSMEYFNIDSLGNKVAVDKEDPKAGRANAVTVQIKNQTETKKITYISGDISDDGIKKKPGIMKYVKQQVPADKTTTFIKSASYLLHYGTFNEIRNQILDVSKVIFQDDTGIPYRYFSEDKWTVALFGVYKTPIKDFSSNLFQNDLNKAYKDSTKYQGALPFSLGYHWNSKDQNQMFIFKK